jgi:hypothetical protein
MFKQEADWFRENIREIPIGEFSPIANIGAQSDLFRTQMQPFIDQLIFNPIRERGAEVINIDLVPGKGIDQACDITDKNVIHLLSKYKFKSVFCSNLLEHISDRGRAIDNIQSILQPRSYLFISCPYKFPYHPDPIDTMYRPNIEELLGSFYPCTLVTSKIVSCGTFQEHRHQNVMKTILRMLLPIWKTASWIQALPHVPYILSPYKASCVILRKPE